MDIRVTVKGIKRSKQSVAYNGFVIDYKTGRVEFTQDGVIVATVGVEPFSTDGTVTVMGAGIKGEIEFSEI